MKLSNLLSEDRVFVHVDCATLAEALALLVRSVRAELGELAPEGVVAKILQREQDHPSLVEDGILLAHLRAEGIRSFVLALAGLEKSVRHPGASGTAVDLIFLVLAPQLQNALMLQTLASIRRLPADRNFLPTVRSVRTPARLIRVIEESGVEVKRNLTAGDIMEPLEGSVRLDTPLATAVRALADARDEGLPVLDEKDHLAGEITTREILLLGMPKYMDLLSNPEMLNAFEPFENYFRHEEELKVRDICRRDFGSVAPATPIVRVAHQMITENRRRIYVTHDDRIEGVIYRKSILLRVMLQ